MTSPGSPPPPPVVSNIHDCRSENMMLMWALDMLNEAAHFEVGSDSTKASPRIPGATHWGTLLVRQHLRVPQRPSPLRSRAGA